MSTQKRSIINAAVFFVLWSLFAYAIADHPVPSGFPWVFLGTAVGAAVVHWRVPTYIAWQRTRRRGRRWRAILDGLIAGVVMLAISLLMGRGKSEVPMRTFDYVVLFVLMIGFGLFNAVVVYGVNALIERRAARKAVVVDAEGREE